MGGEGRIGQSPHLCPRVGLGYTARVRPALVCTLALGLLASGSASADPLRVVYQVDASAGSWRPISSADLAKVVETAALAELSRAGALRLERSRGPGSGQAPGAYRLQITSHVLDEAMTHTTSLELSPGTEHDLPSLSAARTVTLSKLSRGRMLERIEKSARAAAKVLAKSLKAPLGRARRTETPHFEVDEPFDLKVSPWRWAPVRVPAGAPGKAGRQLYARRTKVKKAALRVLTSAALVEDSPRNVLERCVLEHPDEQMRLGCLEGLRPISRRRPPTARVVVEVYRKDNSPKVRREANDQMVYFTGAAKQAALQAWLEAAARGLDGGPLEDLGDLPNLDVTIRKCMEATGRKRGHDNRPRFRCLALLEPLPHARRRAILWRFIREMDPGSPYYLEGAGEREGSRGTPWQRAVDALLEDAPSWDPKLEEILWARYQRTLSKSAMSTLCAWGAPSERLAGRLLEILQTKGESRALHGLVRIAKLDPSLAPKVKAGLSEMLAMGTFHKGVGERELTRAIRRLSPKEER